MISSPDLYLFIKVFSMDVRDFTILHVSQKKLTEPQLDIRVGVFLHFSHVKLTSQLVPHSLQV